jgi:hypothetical protein
MDRDKFVVIHFKKDGERLIDTNELKIYFKAILAPTSAATYYFSLIGATLCP